ncbi:MAG: 4-hydroxythreonine-4-phosphate dehydrogenase PdxA [Acidibacillus sp.]|nr:4-hydroxythreonine-4-phosphate dehydrogenase PdxA [Acidibacillus sp.]
MKLRPILGITIGDPAGIGPEITLKALTNKEIYQQSRPLVIGSLIVMEKISEICNIDCVFNRVTSPTDGRYEVGIVDVYDIEIDPLNHFTMGKVQSECGQAAFMYITKAVNLANDGEIDAIVTAPINKEALKAAKVPYIGHTEMIADLQHAESVMTMFLIENTKIFFLTRHVPLIEACRQVNNKDFVLDGIKRAYKSLQNFSLKQPKLAVAGLNPHSGEGGLLGMEERNSIKPAIEQAVANGLDVVGPVPADSVFHFARKGAYDAVLALYHDQGHIAAKVMDFEKTVSITIGLPTLRTSVDHGTAFDIAGQGIASEVSMLEALKAAIKYAEIYTSK